jgi:hypothetical protein
MPSISHLTNRETNRLMRLLREAGIKPPRKGFSIKALGGSVIHWNGGFRTIRAEFRSPWQVIDISEESYQYIANRIEPINVQVSRS